MSVLDYPAGSGPLCTSERKKKFIIGGVITTIVVIILIIIICVATSSSKKPGSYVLTQVPLVDGYNNLAQLLRRCKKNVLKEFKFNKDLSDDSQWGEKNVTCQTFTDLVRMKRGQVFGQVWYASALCNAQYKDATSIVLEQIDVLKRLFNSYPDDLQLVSTVGGFMDTYKRGKIANFIGVHGGHALDSRIGILRMFYDLGVRFLTFAPCETPWIDKKINLRDFGNTIIKEANRLGMVLDLTGSQKEIALHVIKESQAPVIYSHTASSGLYNNNTVTNNNIGDDIIQAIRDNNGLIMVTFDGAALSKDNNNITQLLAHIDYIASVGSVDIVGLGSGFGLFKTPVAGVNGTNSYPDIFDALMKYDSRNKNIDWSSMENLKKVASNNFLRVLNDVERIRDIKTATGSPIEDWINTAYLKEIKILQQCSTDPNIGQKTNILDLFYNASVQSNVTATPTIENNIPEETININSEELNPPNPSNITNKIDDMIKIDDSDEMNPF